MLMHPNSKKMRNFILIGYFCGEFSEALKMFKTKFPNESFCPEKFKEIGEINADILIGEYFQTNKERKDRPLHKIYSEITKKLIDQNYPYFHFYIPKILAKVLCWYEVEKYTKAVEIMEKSEEEFKTTWSGGFIYLAYNESLFKRGIDDEVKIGKTISVPERNSSYQTYSPDGFIFERTWTVNDISKAEKFIHNKLSKYQIKEGGGKEWFRLSVNEARQKIDTLIHNYNSQNGFFPDEIKSGKGFG